MSATSGKTPNVVRPDFSSKQSPSIVGCNLGNVIEFAHRKAEMGKKSEQEKEPEKTSQDDYLCLQKRAYLHKRIADPEVTGSELDEIIELLDKITKRAAKKKRD